MAPLIDFSCNLLNKASPDISLFLHLCPLEPGRVLAEQLGRDNPFISLSALACLFIVLLMLFICF